MMRLFQRIRKASPDKKEITANIFWSGAEKILLLLSGIFVYARIATYLGTESFGYFNYLTSIYNIFLPLASLGLSNVLISQLLDKRLDQNSLMGTSALLRLIGALLAIIGNAIFVYVYTEDMGLVYLTFLMSWSYIFTIFMCIDEFFQAGLKSRAISIVRMIIYAIFIALKLFAIHSGWGLDRFILIYGLEFASTTVGMVILFYVQNGTILKWKFNTDYLKRMLVLLAPIFITLIADTLATRYAVIVINRYMDISQVGIYAVAAKLGEVWYFLPVTLCMAIYPKITKLFFDDKRRYKEVVSAVFTVLFLGSLLLTIAVAALSRQLIDILFDPNYLPAALTLSAYMFIGIFISIKTLSQRLFILENVQKYLILFSIVSSIATILSLYVLVPIYGALGAVAGIIIGHIIYLFILPLFFKESRDQVRYIMNGVMPWNYLKVKKLF